MDLEKKKRKKPWSQKEEEMLVEVWGERIHQLRGNRKNSHVYEDMRVDMEKFGSVVSASEIKNKIHNFTTRFRKEKEVIGPSGGSPSTWPLFAAVNNIIGSHKMQNVETLIEESITESDFSNVEALLECESSDNSQSILYEIDFTQASSSSNPKQSSTPSSSPCIPEKRKKIDYQQEILNKIEKLENSLAKQSEEMKSMDEKMYDLEVQKTKLMAKFVASTDVYKNAFINFLKQN